MKWAVSQHPGGTSDSEQYHVRCAPNCSVGHQIVCVEGPVDRHPRAAALDSLVMAGSNGRLLQTSTVS
jgi:hypothetical protein